MTFSPNALEPLSGQPLTLAHHSGMATVSFSESDTVLLSPGGDCRDSNATVLGWMTPSAGGQGGTVSLSQWATQGLFTVCLAWRGRLENAVPVGAGMLEVVLVTVDPVAEPNALPRTVFSDVVFELSGEGLSSSELVVVIPRYFCRHYPFPLARNSPLVTSPLGYWFSVFRVKGRGDRYIFPDSLQPCH